MTKRLKCCASILTLLFLFFQSCTETSRDENGGWTEEVVSEQIEGCIRKAKTSYEKNPEFTKKICECSVRKSRAIMTFKESTALLKKSKEEQTKIINPLLKACMEEIKASSK